MTRSMPRAFDDGVQLPENGMARIGPEKEGAALLFLLQIPGLGQTIQFFLDGVGRDRRLRCQFPSDNRKHRD